MVNEKENNSEYVDSRVEIMYAVEKEEILDIVSRGKSADRLKSPPSFTKRRVPPILKEGVLKEFTYEKPLLVYAEVSAILRSLNSIELELKREIANEALCVNSNECPICREEIMERNYVMPFCGHGVCIDCLVRNLKRGENGEKCSICRRAIV
jgi:hypothetical protein